MRLPYLITALAIVMGSALSSQLHAQSADSNSTLARHDFPYESRYVEVLGSNMHYVDTGGEGSVVVMIHGQPTWSYLWRDIIPHLEDQHRVIALDLIGFGKSDQPDIEYYAHQHAEYLQGFMDALELEYITLVIHDWGSVLGFDFAARNPDRVKAIAFMEAAVMTGPREAPYGAPRAINGRNPEDTTSGFVNILTQIKTPGVGEQMILEDNFFLEGMVLPSFSGLLTEDEMNAYREPFAEGRNRRPMLQFPRDVPMVEPYPAYTVEMMTRYNQYLRTRPDLPKLLLHVSDGFLIDRWDVEWMRRNLEDLTIHSMGPGGHFMQEFNPDSIGQAISLWMQDNDL